MYVKHFFDVFVGGIEVERNESSALMDIDLPKVPVPLEDLMNLMPSTSSVTPKKFNFKFQKSGGNFC